MVTSTASRGMIIKPRSFLSWFAGVILSTGAIAAGDHGESDRPGLVYTHYTQQTELFVEFPALVVGEVSPFAAHLTRLSDYRPVTSGQLDVVLLQGERVVARFRVNEPARTGIFIPQVKPRQAGTFDLALVIEDGPLLDQHDLGPVTVFASKEQATVNQPKGEGDIGYLKEQQWTNPFSTIQARHVPIRPSVPAFATVLAPADGSATVVAPSDGYLATEDLAGLGQIVSEGDLIARLIPRLGGATDVGSLRVGLQRARSQVTLATSEQQRVRELLDVGAVPAKRMTEAEQALEIAQSELAAATARLEQAQSAGKASGIELKAPVGGEVVEIAVRPGAFVEAGSLMFSIATPDRRWLRLQVPEAFSAGVPRSSGGWIEVNGEVLVLDASVGAQVVRSGGVIDQATRTLPVIIEYPSAIGPYAIGGRYSGGVYTDQASPRLAVPRSAIIDDAGRTVVYVQTGGEMFIRRPLELGIADGDWVEARSGVELGDRVVNQGAYYVKLAAAGGEDIGHGHAH